MPIDFTKVSFPKVTQRPLDPIALFQGLRGSDAAINDLWLAQGDALRSWHENRTAADTAIVLNTGAGKTLVGVLAAQSLVNETGGHVLYACSSIQLVEQTAAKARGYGLEVTTYFRAPGGARATFSNDLYHQGLAPCVTTYQALFNGKSRFLDGDVAGIVFDDAHTAEHLLRDQFSLEIDRTRHTQAFTELAQLFRPYFAAVDQEMGYVETLDRSDVGGSWFVPPFALRKRLGEVRRILLELVPSEHVDTMFAWAHLRDHLDLCALFVSHDEIILTPPVVPVRFLPYFGPRVRRLYLSATLSADDAFYRSFGRIPDRVIAPVTAAGECERLILMPSRRENARDQIVDLETAKTIIRDQKCLVLVPSWHRASVWADAATVQGETTTEQVETFKQMHPPACLLLTARYDGLDLPGDTCRMMVIDDLPTGLNPLERYLWERLGLGQLLRSTVASRIVQSFGRISRGMNDHGVVLLTGGRLVDWVLSPKNRSALPSFLRRQLQLGIHISSTLNTTQEFVDAASQCLRRDAGWLAYYEQYMEGSADDRAVPAGDNDAIRITKADVDFGHSLWAREYAAAAKALEVGLEQTFATSRPTGAWHALWLGYAYELLGDGERAADLYRRAHGAEKSIPPVEAALTATNRRGYPRQVAEVARSLQDGLTAHLSVPPEFDTDLAALDGTGSAAQTEAALEALGEYLGLNASRPDHEYHTGPDVLWSLEAAPSLSLEVKTDKEPSSVYRKAELGQLRDHLQWVRDQGFEGPVYSAFVGPRVSASPESNPDSETMVVALDAFRELRERLRGALVDVSVAGLPITAETCVNDLFSERGLLWPDCYDRLPKVALRTIPFA